MEKCVSVYIREKNKKQYMSKKFFALLKNSAENNYFKNIKLKKNNEKKLPNLCIRQGRLLAERMQLTFTLPTHYTRLFL